MSESFDTKDKKFTVYWKKPKDIYNTSYPYPFIKELPKLSREAGKMPRWGKGFVKATNFIDFDTI